MTRREKDEEAEVHWEAADIPASTLVGTEEAGFRYTAKADRRGQWWGLVKVYDGELDDGWDQPPIGPVGSKEEALSAARAIGEDYCDEYSVDVDYATEEEGEWTS